MIHRVVLFLVLTSPVVAWRQALNSTSEEVLAVEQTVELAFAQNRQVKNAASGVDKAGDDVAAAQTQRWPSLNFSIRGTHNFTKESYTVKAGQLGAFRSTGPIPSTDIKLKSPSDLGRS